MINIQNQLKSHSIEDSYTKELINYLHFVNKTSDTFVFMFSSFGKINPITNNRPTKLSLEFTYRKTPVLYSFWKCKNSNDQSMYKWDGGNLFQIPIDKTLKYIMDIITYNFKFKNKIFILNFPYPEASKCIDVFKFYGWYVIYDISDDWKEFHYLNQAKWYKEPYELYSIIKSDLTIATSKPLVDKFISKVDKNIHLVPNALDSNIIVSKSKLCPLIDTSKYKRLKIGYIGNLTSSCFNWDGLIYIANNLPQYTFEIIGNNIPYKLESLPNNIVYLGVKNYAEVKEISKEWKIGIIPFKINKLTESLNPIKAYDYLVLGLKVISFTMFSIKDYPEVKCASTCNEFIDFINISMNEKFDYKSVKNFLSNNLWSNRIDQILDLISKNLVI
jgi:hypothetical protein